MTVPYTVVGEGSGTVPNHSGLTVALMVRGLLASREDLARTARRVQPARILFLEERPVHYDVDALVSTYPELRVLYFKEQVPRGQMVEVALSEAATDYVLVLDGPVHDLRLPRRLPVPEEDVVVSVPALRFAGEPLPSVYAPAFSRRLLKVLPLGRPAGGTPTILIPGYTGLYRRDLVEAVGGFDPEIPHPYWQRLEFAFRCFLFGYRLLYYPHVEVELFSQPAPEDLTPDSSSFRFFLKVLAPRRKEGKMHLSLWRALHAGIRAGVGWQRAVREFRDVRRWLEETEGLFRQDAVTLVASWEVEEV
ncbi:hypothetical protein [Spirochaeta thermophila]|uniref:Glycosyltransferase n=1 Tax=Winmispira thermophila (strain ATCC 49972 / DSM 6192 / RI 19.B1) TaxID=665571 RepID=E0RSC0_WINT6|nr:hypothetical protein [Spirochaeta thermophila]ADN01907.1 hypothetical protein STHERM_c09610 [Spirochaeta thermophila DSM 6192]